MTTTRLVRRREGGEFYPRIALIDANFWGLVLGEIGGGWGNGVLLSEQV